MFLNIVFRMKKKLLDFYCRLLSFFARKYIAKHKPLIIGINWSVWKTSCRMIIYQTLCKFINNKEIYTSSKNFNWELWLSLAIFKIEEFSPTPFCIIKTLCSVMWMCLFWKKPYDITILEYWIDHPWEMEFLLQIVRPQIWVFTAIDSVHSMQFGNPKNIAKEEKKMIQNTLEFALLNIDDSDAMSLVDDIEIDYLTYQTQWYDSKWDITFSNEKFDYKDENLFSNFDLSIRQKNINITTNILWKANYGYIWVALAILDIINYKDWKASIFDSFDKIFLEYKLQWWRLSVFNWLYDSILFDSTYNSSPLSVQKILNTVYSIKNDLFSDSEIRVMLGDMRELWDLTESDHRKIASYVHSVADRLFLVWENMRKYLKDELEKIWYDMSKVEEFNDSITLWNFVKEELKKSNWRKLIVWKGSQNTIYLEEAIKILLANDEDAKNLVRQSNWWLKKKKRFFD